MTGNYFLVKSAKTMKTYLIALLDAKCFYSPFLSLENRSSDLNRFFLYLFIFFKFFF